MLTPFLKIPLELQGANALCGSTAIGYPGMPGFLGFANAFRRNCEVLTGPSRVTSVAVVHHAGRLRTAGRYKDRLTHKRSVHDASDKSPRSFFSTPTEAQPQIDLECTVIIGMDIDLRFTEDAGTEAVEKNESSPFDRFIPVRALGGRCVPTGNATLFLEAEEALRRSRSGWVVVDRTKELADQDRNPIEALLWRCRKPSFEGTAPDDGEVGRVPMHVGYAGIGPGARRSGSRDPDTDHFFAEPITGLARFVRKYEVIAEGAENALWVPTIDRENRIFKLTGRT